MHRKRHPHCSQNRIHRLRGSSEQLFVRLVATLSQMFDPNLHRSHNSDRDNHLDIRHYRGSRELHGYTRSRTHIDRAFWLHNFPFLLI